jgi:hypothetical protein
VQFGETEDYRFAESCKEHAHEPDGFEILDIAVF